MSTNRGQGQGFAVDLAHNGIDGLWVARENSYDVIVLDIMMPGMSGYRVCEKLRAEKNWTPMLTAKVTGTCCVGASDAQEG